MRRLPLLTIALALACSPAGRQPPAPAAAPGSLSPGTYVDPPSVGTFPSSRATVQAWIDSLDVASVRAHAWDIWASITSPSGVGNLPVWETWYSGHEVFDLAFMGTAEERARLAAHPYEYPRQLHSNKASSAKQLAIRSRAIPQDLAETPFAFNRFTRNPADVIVRKRYNLAATFDSLNAAFDRNNTPVAARKIETSVGEVDPLSFVTKVVFQFIRGDSASVIPYWGGVQPQATTDLDNPTPSTWRHGVVVDPTGTLEPGTRVMASVNNEPPRMLPVVSLDAFYHRTITCQDSVHFTMFGAVAGDDVGFQNKTDSASIVKMVRPGNIALLMAMHVTGKEISNWTWQTFWWSPDPKDPGYGNDRPATVRPPWNHYLMNAAYWMADPVGNPLITFNPYLETSLVGAVFTPALNGGYDSIPWTGVHTNCMTCHRRAVLPGPNVTRYSQVNYWPDGFIDAADSLMFSGTTKADFLWSIVTRVRTDSVPLLPVYGACPSSG